MCWCEFVDRSLSAGDLWLANAEDARQKRCRSFRSALADSKMAAVSPERKRARALVLLFEKFVIEFL